MAAMNEKAMLLDVSRCIACRACQVACKQWNELPAEKTHFTGTYQNPPRQSAKTWTLIYFIEPEEGETRWLFRKQQCLHCTEASCVQVCPTGAAQKRDDGVVIIDQNICTGCKYCVEVCPFETPQFDSDTGTAKKCNFCIDRVTNGLEPACAKACPTGAIFYGTRERVLQEAKKRQKALAQKNPGHQVRIYGGKDELGGLGVVYLLPEKASIYGLPEHPRLPTEKIIFKWLLGIVPGLAILYGMWRSFRKGEPIQEEETTQTESNSGGV